MERRDLLARLGVVLGGLSLGGCLGRSGPGGAGETTIDAADGTTTDATDETTADDATDQTTTAGGQESANRQPSVAGTRLEVTGSSCGEPTSDASVEFPEQSSVVVTGTIPGSNQCHVAELADASYDPDTGAFVVTVASVQEEGADVCAQCITQIGYEATVTFEGGRPGAVEVVHEAMDESTAVASVRSGGSATTAAGTATEGD